METIEKKQLMAHQQDSESDIEDDQQNWDDWNDEDSQHNNNEQILCLFCENSKFSSCDTLFNHCVSCHHFDFVALKKSLNLDFYACFRLFNYVRSQVAENKCWSCGVSVSSRQELLDHLHEVVVSEDFMFHFDDTKYLKPFMPEDALLYSFADDEEGEDDWTNEVEYEDVVGELRKFEETPFADENGANNDVGCDNEKGESSFYGQSNGTSSLEKAANKDFNSMEIVHPSDTKSNGSHLNSGLESEIKSANKNYFGAYSSFGIHREMLSDTVRMDAYKQAILGNPSLLKGAVVMDVGCGTGILSLFAAKAGASRVIAVEASEKMAAVATQIAKDNCLLRCAITNTSHQTSGVVEVVQSMVEDLEKSIQIQPQSIDVLVSEWMGYCLLYESMLSSVIFARDQWLKPGGAVLPDTATIFVAGFGRGGTSLPFWEDVHGFNMSSVGKELVECASQIPIVDVVDEVDIMTDATILKTFDLSTMKPNEVDFTANAVLEPKLNCPTSNTSDTTAEITWCYGVVLWFDTGFTSRFCKENPANLSTSPFTTRTHWSQTILTFREPIAVSLAKSNPNKSAAVGTTQCPAIKLELRLSIARAVQHRSIDISLETAGIDAEGRKQNWPVQIFNLS